MTSTIEATWRTVSIVLIGLLLVNCVTPGEAPDRQKSIAGPATSKLLDEARHAEHEKRFDLAADQVERALRIEPENPYLWHELARIALLQGRSRDALQFATKSNFLNPDSSLRSDNWQLMARAYTIQGDRERARQARQNAANQ